MSVLIPKRDIKQEHYNYTKTLHATFGTDKSDTHTNS